MNPDDLALMSAPTIPKQNWCCLPWCGSTSRIHMHHVVRRSRTNRGKERGPTVPLCAECHDAHHTGRRPLTFVYFTEWWVENGSTCRFEKLVTAAEWDH